jgi:hypothetical protein
MMEVFMKKSRIGIICYSLHNGSLLVLAVWLLQSTRFLLSPSPQLDAYRRAVEAASMEAGIGKKVLAALVHMPVIGKVYE